MAIGKGHLPMAWANIFRPSSFCIKHRLRMIFPHYPSLILMASHPQPINSDTACCTGLDANNPGCFSWFPRKSTPGLCARCVALALCLAEDQLDKFQLKEKWPQCEDCGTIAPFFQNNLCGACKGIRTSLILSNRYND